MPLGCSHSIHPDDRVLPGRALRGRGLGQLGAAPDGDILRKPAVQHHGQPGVGHLYPLPAGSHTALHPDGRVGAAERHRRPDVPGAGPLGRAHTGRTAAHQHRVLRHLRRLFRLQYFHRRHHQPGGAANLPHTGLQRPSGGGVSGRRRNTGHPDTSQRAAGHLWPQHRHVHRAAVPGRIHSRRLDGLDFHDSHRHLRRHLARHRPQSSRRDLSQLAGVGGAGSQAPLPSRRWSS